MRDHPRAADSIDGLDATAAKIIGSPPHRVRASSTRS
jgi:hypothetical protein